MTETECRLFMKDFFEKYYAKLSEQSDIAVILPDVPEEMWAEDANPKEEWKKWKLIPATVSEEDIAVMESNVGVPFPDVLKIFLTTYFHFFDDPVGRHPVNEPFCAVKNAWNPLLVRLGYLPFAWDRDGYFIRCIDLANMPDEEHCAVCQIDHEILFDFDEDSGVGREEIEEKMEAVSENFIEYLKSLLD